MPAKQDFLAELEPMNQSLNVLVTGNAKSINSLIRTLKFESKYL